MPFDGSLPIPAPVRTSKTLFGFLKRKLFGDKPPCTSACCNPSLLISATHQGRYSTADIAAIILEAHMRGELMAAAAVAGTYRGNPTMFHPVSFSDEAISYSADNRTMTVDMSKVSVQGYYCVAGLLLRELGLPLSRELYHTVPLANRPSDLRLMIYWHDIIVLSPNPVTLHRFLKGCEILRSGAKATAPEAFSINTLDFEA